MLRVVPSAERKGKRKKEKGEEIKEKRKES